MFLSTTVRTARAQVIIDDAGASATLKFYNGTRPATGGAVTTQTLLATMTGSTTIGTASAGAIDINEAGFTQSSASHVAGTPTWVRLATSGGTVVADLVVGSDITFSGAISTGVDVTLNSSTITEGNAS
jgi:hypothetical protein